MSAGEGKASSNLERLRELIWNRQKLAPIAGLVDAHVESVDPGRVRIRYAVKPEFMHPGSAVQGGVVTVYADMAMAMAAHTLCGEEEFMTTTQLSISFLVPVTRGPVFGEGAVVKHGRSTFFMEAVVKDGEGVELARATSVGVVRRLKR